MSDSEDEVKNCCAETTCRVDLSGDPANNAVQVRFNFVPTLTDQLFRLCDKNLFKLSYENVHLFVTTLCQLFVSSLFQVVTKIGTKLEQSWNKNLGQFPLL